MGRGTSRAAALASISPHSFGAAIDVRPLEENEPAAGTSWWRPIQTFDRLIDTFAEFGYGWGGNFADNFDPQHCELIGLTDAGGGSPGKPVEGVPGTMTRRAVFASVLLAVLASVSACSEGGNGRADTSTTSTDSTAPAATPSTASSAPVTTVVPPLASAYCADSPSDKPVAITDAATLEDLQSLSRVEGPGPFLYAKVYCGASPAGVELFVVRSAEGPSPPTGIVLTDADGDGVLVDESSQGLVPSLFTSETGNSAVGKSLFATHSFAYASTTLDSVVSILMTSGNRQEQVPVSADGVADVTAAWDALSDPGVSFRVKWLDSGGTAVDGLSGAFPGVIR